MAIEGNTLNIESITAIIDNKRIVGPEKEIIEVKNAIIAYDQIQNYKSFDEKDFLKAHGLLLKNLMDKPGRYRDSQVGIMTGSKVSHIAPPSKMIPTLMKDLFEYLKKDSDLDIIKSCVFHYELEFIHPFEDGNGRMGRLWQTRLLMDVNPIFKYVPVEKQIKDNQKRYYEALSISDKNGNSTIFIEFMLEMINETLRATIDESKPLSPAYSDRVKTAANHLKGWFDRKDYMLICKGISTATASRDLKQLILENRVEKAGEKRLAKYRFK